jgi:hypothetical protein
LSFIIFDPFIDLFITLCIVVNTLFMALDHHDMDPGMNDTLKNGNYVSPGRGIANLEGVWAEFSTLSWTVLLLS